MPLSVGDVVRLFDGTMDNPKPKLFLCVCATEHWFFRINTNPYWPPHLLLPRTENEACLAHDCYLQLNGVVEHYHVFVEDELRVPANHLGALSVDTLRNLIAFLPTVKTLTAGERDSIIANLTAVVDG
jgi:hypothetical protein